MFICILMQYLSVWFFEEVIRKVSYKGDRRVFISSSCNSCVLLIVPKIRCASCHVSVREVRHSLLALRNPFIGPILPRGSVTWLAWHGSACL